MASKAARVAELFGGQARLAAELGITRAVVSRWISPGPRGKHGLVPPQYNHSIMDRARGLSLDLRSVSECLDWVCPCCSRPFEPGTGLNTDVLRSLSARRA